VQTVRSIATAEGPAARSAPYNENNLLDRLSSDSARETHYRHLWERESRLLTNRLGIARGAVLEVGCDWHPARDLFPSPAFRPVAFDADPACAAHALESGQAHEALHGAPDDLPLSPRGLAAAASAAGLRAELHAATYTWRRLSARVQRVLQPLDELGSRPKIARFGHTLMVIASRPLEAT
jgi:hypothetical protein